MSTLKDLKTHVSNNGMFILNDYVPLAIRDFNRQSFILSKFIRYTPGISPGKMNDAYFTCKNKQNKVLTEINSGDFTRKNEQNTCETQSYLLNWETRDFNLLKSWSMD